MPAPVSSRSGRALAKRGIAVAALLLAVPLPGAAGPRDPVYRWTDESGGVRYTTELGRIPVVLRGSATVVQPPPPAPVQLAQPAGTEPNPTRDPVADADLEARIDVLERQIADDEAVLGRYVSDDAEAQRLRASGEVDAIAERLPGLQEELRALQEQRAARTGEADAP